jgi:hypothetical protein
VPVSPITDQAQPSLGNQTLAAGAGRFEQKHRLRCHASALYKKRPITLEVHSGYLTFRVKGLRSLRYAISIERAFFAAAKAETIDERHQLPKLPKKRTAKEVQSD